MSNRKTTKSKSHRLRAQCARERREPEGTKGIPDHGTLDWGFDVNNIRWSMTSGEEDDDKVKSYWKKKYGLECPYRKKPDPKFYDSIPTNSKILPIGKEPQFSPIVHIYEDLPCKGMNHKASNAYQQREVESRAPRWPHEVIHSPGGKFAKPRIHSPGRKPQVSSSLIVEKLFAETFDESKAKIESDLAAFPMQSLTSRMLKLMDEDWESRAVAHGNVQKSSESIAKEKINNALQSIVNKSKKVESKGAHSAQGFSFSTYSDKGRPHTAPSSYASLPAQIAFESGDLEKHTTVRDVSPNHLRESHGINVQVPTRPVASSAGYLAAIDAIATEKSLTREHLDFDNDEDEDDDQVDNLIDSMMHEHRQAMSEGHSARRVITSPNHEDSRERENVHPVDLRASELSTKDEELPGSSDNPESSLKIDGPIAEITPKSSSKQKKTVRLSVVAGAGLSTRRSSKRSSTSAKSIAGNFIRAMREVANQDVDHDHNSLPVDDEDPLSQAIYSRMSDIADAANLKIAPSNVRGRRTLHFQDAVSQMTGDRADIKHKFLAAVKRVNLSNKEKFRSKLETQAEGDGTSEIEHFAGLKATESSKARIMHARKALNLAQAEFHYEKEFDQILEAKRVKWQEFCDEALDLGCGLHPARLQIGKQLFRGKIMSMHNGRLIPLSDDDIDDNDFDYKEVSSTAPLKPVILKVARFGGNVDLALSLFGRVRDEETVRNEAISIKERLASPNAEDFGALEDIPDVPPTIDLGSAPADSSNETEEAKRSRKSSVASNKYPPEAIVQEFKNEMVALSELGKHPNIVLMEGITLVPFCLVIEKMDGLLSDCLENSDWQYQCSVRMRISILKQIAGGLTFMHQNNYVHRDLNPKNISYRQSSDGNFEVKIGDLQKAVKLANFDDHLTIPTGISGYTAPEVYSMCRYGIPADVFSFGILSWELFAQKARKNPLLGLDPFMAATKIESNIRPQFGPEHPILVLELARRCWETLAPLRPSSFSINLMLQDLLSTEESFFHVYDRAFAKEALELVVRENRISVNRTISSPTSSPSIHIPANVTSAIPPSAHSPNKLETKRSFRH